MALKSALEDFEGTTLSAIPGLLGKLHYVARLHDGEGSYSHWGMRRVHGEEAARRAIRTSHATILTQILRTPLRVLAEDLRSSAARLHLTAREFLSSLEKLATQVLPERAGASEKHLTAVLHALSALTQNQVRAIRQDAWPLPPPVR